MGMHSSDRTLLASLGFADPDKKDRRHTLACQYLAQPDVLHRVVRGLVKREFRDACEMTTALAVELSGAPAVPPPVCDGPKATYKTPMRWSGPVYGLRGEMGQLEVPIQRGSGYLVGFWDVRGVVEWSEPWAVVADTYARAKPEPVRPAYPYFSPAYYASVTPGSPGEAAKRAEEERKRQYDIEHDAYEAVYPEWKALPQVFTTRTVEEMSWQTNSATVRIEVKARPVDVADIARQIALYLTDTRLGENDITVVATCYAMSPLDRETLARKGIRHIRLGQPFDDWCKAQANVNAADGGQEF